MGVSFLNKLLFLKFLSLILNVVSIDLHYHINKNVWDSSINF